MSFKTKLPPIEIGVSFKYALRWSVRPNVDAEPNPVDLSLWDGRMQLKTSESASDVYLDISTDNGNLTMGATGVIEAMVPTSQTKPLAPVDEGLFDLVVWPRGNKESAVRLAYGTFAAVKVLTEVPA